MVVFLKNILIFTITSFVFSFSKSIEAQGNFAASSRIPTTYVRGLVGTHSINKEVPATDVTHIVEGDKVGCHVAYDPEQYKIDPTAFIGCLHEELKHKSKYQCAVVYASHSPVGSDEINNALIKKRSRAAFTLVKAYFPNIQCFKVKLEPGQSRSANVMLIPPPAPVIPPPVIKPCPKEPPPKSEFRKIGISAGVGSFVQKSNDEDYIPSHLTFFRISIMPDLIPEQSWGTFYGALTYINGNNQYINSLNQTVVYERTDIDFLLGVTYRLLSTNHTDLSLFVEAGPSYTTNYFSITPDGEAVGNIFISKIFINESAGVKFTLFSRMFARLGGLVSVGPNSSFLRDTTLSGFAYGYYLDIGVNF